jgi:hypothetical protein
MPGGGAAGTHLHDGFQKGVSTNLTVTYGHFAPAPLWPSHATRLQCEQASAMLHFNTDFELRCSR